MIKDVRLMFELYSAPMRRPFALKCDAQDRHDLRGIDTQPVVLKCPGHGAGDELSYGHFGTGAELSGHFGTSETVRHWCQSVLVPICPVTSFTLVSHLSNSYPADTVYGTVQSLRFKF